MAGETCAGYVRSSSFTPWKGELPGNDGFYKSEAWPYWVSALNVKLQVGSFFSAAQSILSASEYASFNARFQKMRADFDSRYKAVEGYGNFTSWCKYLKEGMTWDTQFKLLRTEMSSAIKAAESASKASSAAADLTSGGKTAITAPPAEKKAAEEKAKVEVKKESAPAKKKGRKEKTEAAVNTARGNTDVAAQTLAASGQTAGTVSSISPLDIALWVGGGVLALGVLWTFLPQTKPAVVEKVLDKVLPTPGTATAGLGSFGRYRRHRRR